MFFLQKNPQTDNMGAFRPWNASGDSWLRNLIWMEHTLAVSHFVNFFLKNGLEIHGGRGVHACKKVPNMVGGVAS